MRRSRTRCTAPMQPATPARVPFVDWCRANNGKLDGQLLKFKMDGEFVLQIGWQEPGNDSNSTERLGSPADVAVDIAAREVFAADGYANRRVVVFDSETGEYKRHWGACGNKPLH